MKKLFTIAVFIFFAVMVFSQSKTEFGITTEGSWFMPGQPSKYSDANKNGFGTGIGVYASRNLFWRFSADIGIMYRYKQMQKQYVISYPGADGGYAGYSKTVDGWDKMPMHYIVLPVHLQMLLSKSFYIRGGFEMTWLMNYEAVNEKPEYNWTLGFGSEKHKIKWSINFIRGFKDQGFGDTQIKPDGHYRASINRNNMFQLNLSYPIWQK